MIKKIVLWILLLSMMGLIFFFSSQEASESDKTSSGIIEIIVRFFDFTDSLSDSDIMEINAQFSTLVRKIAHFSIYTLLSVLASLLLCEYNVLNRKQFICAVVFSFLYACSDELHQCFVNGRSGQISDVLLDTLGASFGAFTVLLISKGRKKDVLHRKI